MAEGTKLTAKTPEAKKENSASQIKKTNSSPSISSSVDHILFLQRTVGNQAVEKLLKSGVIQAKLTIGQPGDIYEQEADRIAEQVMRMPDSGTTERKGVSEYNKSPSVQRVCAECEEELQRQTQDSELGYLEFGHSTEDGLHRRKEGIQIQRMCTECEEELQRQPMEEEEEELIQTKLTSSDHPRLQRQEDLEEEEEILQAKQVTGETPEVTPELGAQISSIRSGGQPLPESVRAFFEPRLGVDRSQRRASPRQSLGRRDRESGRSSRLYLWQQHRLWAWRIPAWDGRGSALDGP